MKKWFRGVNKRVIGMLLCMVFMVSSFMSGTLTWFSIASAKNEFSGTKGNYSVTLTKLEKDAADEKGEAKDVTIKDAEFYLYRITNADPEQVQQIGNRYKTDKDGRIEVKDLVAGAYYFQETNPSYGYDYDVEGEENTPKHRYDFMVGEGYADATGMVAVKAYNRRVLSELTVTKTVVNKDGTDVTDKQAKQDFTFRIAFGDKKTYQYKIDDGKAQDLADGKFTLKHGQTATFLKVPAGLQYTVSEEACDDYATVSENHTGNIGLNGSAAKFTNTYGPGRTGTLEISKTVTGRGDKEKVFTFEVTLGTDKGISYPYDVYDKTGKIGEGSIKSGEKLKLTHGQKAIFTGLSEGLHYDVQETDEEGYTELIARQTGQIIETGSKVLFVNDKDADPEYGRLIVRKSVVGEDGDTNKEFQFSIMVGEQHYTCTLKDGQEWTLDNIPVGTRYQVVEADYAADGYVTSALNSNSTVVTGDNIARFTNAKEEIPDDKEGSLTLTKRVTGAGADGQEFQFYVQIGNDAPEKVTLKDGESKTWKEIPVGTHYSILEDDYYSKGYITTGDGATGTIVEAGAKALYTNKRGETPEPETGALEISKVVSGAGDQNKSFTFKVEFSDGKDYPYKYDDGKEGTSKEEKELYALDQKKLTLKHGERAIFEGIPAGVNYVVTEEKADTYLQGVVTQTGTIAGQATVYARYENYRIPQEGDGRLIVKKTTTGEGANKNKKFDFVATIGEETHEFALADGEEKSFALPQGTAYDVAEKDYTSQGYSLTSVIRGNGTGDGTVIEVLCTNTYIGEVLTDFSGTKTWDVPEGTKLPDSITVYLKQGDNIVATKEVTAKDNWKYTFKDVPKYDQAGKEIAYTVDEAAVESFAKTVTGMDIKNTYVNPVTQTGLEVQKQIAVNGSGTPKKATFSFALQGINEAPMPSDSDGSKKTVQRTGAGSVNFGDITYTTPGVYTYQVTEVMGAVSGYTYDTSAYTWTVTVTQEGKGLKAAGTLTKAGKEAASAVFTNTYVADEAGTTSLTVNKEWAGTVNPKQPASVQVQLYKNGAKSGKAVTLNSKNNWVHTWTGLSKDAAWTVNETAVPKDYVKTISQNGKSGYTITNTYTPSGQTPGGGGGGNTGGGGTSYGNNVKGPKTNDPIQMWLWFAIMIASIIGLRVFVFNKKMIKK